MVERRAVLSGALAGIAIGCVGCGEATDVVAVSPTEAPVDDPPTTSPPAPDGVVGLEVEADLFGRIIDVGAFDDYHDSVQRAGGFRYEPKARAWLVSYPTDRIDKALSVYPEAIHEGLHVGVLALYQKCPHLGCRIPDCGQSQQFECPCHGSKYSNAGEYLDGPAPRGMTLFPTQIVDGRVLIDTLNPVDGLARGVNVTGWELVDNGCLSDLES